MDCVSYSYTISGTIEFTVSSPLAEVWRTWTASGRGSFSDDLTRIGGSGCVLGGLRPGWLAPGRYRYSFSFSAFGPDNGAGPHSEVSAVLAIFEASDCNGNCFPDTEDIASGVSADSNANGIPDECEVSVESTFGDPTGGEGTSFGRAVATDGSTAVIGAPSAGTEGAGAGEAWVYRSRSDSEWASTQRLRSSTPVSNGQFGIDAVLVDDRAIVGALSEGASSDGSGTASGAIHVFARADAEAAFAHVQRIAPPDPTAGQAFGFGLSAWGAWLAVGSYNDDDGGDNAGAVYLYEFDPATSQYEFRQKLVPSDTAVNQKFGVDTDMVDGVLLVGAFRDGAGSEYEAGAAYVYELDASGSWSEAQKLRSNPPVPGAWFGDRVAMTRDRLVVTASKETVSGVADGAAYVFARAEGGWIQTDRLEAPAGTGGTWFGSAATVSGATTVVGGRGVTANGIGGGAAFRFGLDGSDWLLDETISPADPVAGANYGWALDLAGGMLLVGSPGASQASLFRRSRDCDGNGVDDDLQLDTGDDDCNANLVLDACEIASGIESDCNGNGVPDSCEIADGSATDFNANGIPDACEETVIVSVPSTFETIGEAIAAASNGWVIEVAPGTYSEAIDLGVKGITITSTAGAGFTTLDAAGIAPTAVLVGPTASKSGAVIRGLTIRGGAGGTPVPTLTGVEGGGGVFLDRATCVLEDCVIADNGAGFGAGIYAYLGHVEMRHVTVVSNQADTHGGGIVLYECEAILEGVLVESNSAGGRGGGLYAVRGTPTVLGSEFIANDAGSSGGGVAWFAGDQPLRLEEVLLEANLAASGGDAAWILPNASNLVLDRVVVCGSGPAPFSGQYTVAGEVVIDELCIDCDENGVPDAWEYLLDIAADADGDGIIDACECLGDLDLNGVVNGADLSTLFQAWGEAGGAADLNGDGTVDGADLGVLLLSWGDCP